jgi:hypothetical protein
MRTDLARNFAHGGFVLQIVANGSSWPETANNYRFPDLAFGGSKLAEIEKRFSSR